MNRGPRSPKDFLVFCMAACEENPFCNAFEVEDGGDNFRQSGSWEVGPTTTCRMYSAVEISETSDPGRDCFINHERVSIPSLPEDFEAGPALCVDEPGQRDCVPSCREGCDQWCDSVAGETWCEAEGRCLNAAEVPCMGPKDLSHSCPPGEAYCYCDGTCGDPSTRTCAMYSHDASNPGVVTWGDGFEFDCWVVTNGHDSMDMAMVLQEGEAAAARRRLTQQ